MTKIVISSCFGGFGLSKAAYEYMGIPWDGYGFASEVSRTDPKLIACVEVLGDAASGLFAKLKIVEIPDDVLWKISEYDGLEYVAECHRTWS